MDWTKAKNILIVALLLTDFILGGLFYFQHTGDEGTQESVIEATIEVLENHNIFVDTEIPEKTRRMPVLFVKYDEEDEDLVRSVLSRQVKNDSFTMTEQNLKTLCDSILRECGFTEETLVYDSWRIDGEGAEVVYKNIYNGIPVEESGIRCRVEKGEVVRLDRLWLTPTGYGKTKQRVIQSSEALIQFMSERVKENENNGEDEIPEEIHIQKIDLVYWLDLSVGPSDGVTEDTAVPAWRFTYNDGNVTFIDAYDQQQ